MATLLRTNLLDPDMGDFMMADPFEPNVVDLAAAGPIADPNDPGMQIDTFLQAPPSDDPDLMNGGGDPKEPDDTPKLTLSAVSASKSEGTGGSTMFTFKVTRAGDPSIPVSAHWSTTGQGVNPANGVDFTGGVLPSGTISLAAGQTSKTINVSVAGDSKFENDEGFAMTLSSPSGAVLGAVKSATGTILDDDKPTLSIKALDTVKNEGSNNGITPFTFDVTRTGDTSMAATGQWTVIDNSWLQGEADKYDFPGYTFPQGTVNFAPGQTHQTVTVNVYGDNEVEADEEFTVGLWSNSASTAVDYNNDYANGTILNDEQYSFAYVEWDKFGTPEGDSGSTPITFTFQRTNYGDHNRPITVDWAVPAKPNAGITASDFVGGVLPSGTAYLAPGQMQTTITVNVAGDMIPEADEIFDLVLSTQSYNAVLTNPDSVGKILNDDGPNAIDPAPSSARPDLDAGSTDGITVDAATLRMGLGDMTPKFADLSPDGGWFPGADQWLTDPRPGDLVKAIGDIAPDPEKFSDELMRTMLGGADMTAKMDASSILGGMTWNDGIDPAKLGMMIRESLA